MAAGREIDFLHLHSLLQKWKRTLNPQFFTHNRDNLLQNSVLSLLNLPDDIGFVGMSTQESILVICSSAWVVHDARSDKVLQMMQSFPCIATEVCMTQFFLQKIELEFNIAQIPFSEFDSSCLQSENLYCERMWYVQFICGVLVTL